MEPSIATFIVLYSKSPVLLTFNFLSFSYENPAQELYTMT